MRILITGSKGQLGKEIVNQLRHTGHTILATTSKTLDIRNQESIIELFKAFTPEIVINCASYTAVDDCEDLENYNIAYETNVEAVKSLAIECEKYKAKLVHFSTDYVFNGEESSPIKEEHSREPVNKYGLTKMLSEDMVVKYCSRYYIIRTSWLYGDGKNFVNTMINLAMKKFEISVVGDQVGSPTYTKDLTWVVLKLIQSDFYGIYHGTNHGECSWYEFAIEIFSIMDINIVVNKVTSEDYIRRAKRPRYSTLDNNKLRKIELDLFRPWKDALIDYLGNTK